MKTKYLLLYAFLLILTLLILLTFTGCSTTTQNSSSDFSVLYTDAFGYTSHINAVPETIISLSPNTTEIICTLGLESKLIGRTDYCDYPNSVSSIQSIGSVTEPNTELIISLGPDIIITDGMQSEEFITNLRNLGLTVIIVRANETIDGTYDIISDIGKITNTDTKSKEVINYMKDEFLNIQNTVNSITDKKTVYYSISLSEAGLYTAGNNTYINELLNKAGLINIATDMEGWTYSIEKLIEHDPDIIICSTLYNAKEGLLEFEPLKDLTAISNNNIIEIDENLISRQSPRNIEGIKQLIELIYNIKID